MAGAGRRAFLTGLRACGYAFTMAEILLSLTIIGVVAAITLPSLTGNINERTWNTQRKALYARFSQAIALMPSLNGYGKFSTDENGSVVEDTAAETFVTNGLSKVLKINNICDAEHLSDCGLPDKIIPARGDSINLSDIIALADFNSKFGNPPNYESLKTYNTKAAAFETANGESIMVYYPINCVESSLEIDHYAYQYIGRYMCANFIYDLNGKKGPNTFGKDIGFITALHPVDPIVVAPMPLNAPTSTSGNLDEAGNLCKQMDSESRLPNSYELMAMAYNNIFLNLQDSYNGYYWSSTLNSDNNAWLLSFNNALTRIYNPRNNRRGLWCVKR